MRILKLLITILLPLNVAAMDLHEALSEGYQYNKDLKKSQEEYKQSIEKFPQALSNYLPHVSAKHTITSQKYTYEKPKTISKSKLDSTQIQVTQTIYNSSAMAGIKAASYQVDAAKYIYFSAEQKAILDSIEVYLDYLVSQKKLDAANSSVAFNDKQAKSTNSRFRLGEATKTEAAQANAALADAKVQRNSALVGVRSHEGKFRTTFGVMPSSLSLPTYPTELPKDFDQFFQEAIASNYSLLAAKNNAQVAKSSLDFAKGALLPTLSAQASHTKNSSPRDLTSMGSTPKYNSSAALVLEVPIFSGGNNYSKIRERKAGAREAQYKLDNMIDIVNTNAVVAWEQYKNALESVKAAEDSLVATKLAVDGMKKQYDVGLKPLQDVLQEETKLFKSKIQAIEAKKKALVAAYSLQSMVGQLTASHLGLDAEAFNPDREFKNIKYRLVGY